MPTGIPKTSEHTALAEPWRQRTEKSALAAAEKRIRGKVAELYELSERAAGGESSGLSGEPSSRRKDCASSLRTPCGAIGWNAERSPVRRHPSFYPGLTSTA